MKHKATNRNPKRIGNQSYAQKHLSKSDELYLTLCVIDQYPQVQHAIKLDALDAYGDSRHLLEDVIVMVSKIKRISREKVIEEILTFSKQYRSLRKNCRVENNGVH